MHRCVVFGSDDAVRGAAFAGDVAGGLNVLAGGICGHVAAGGGWKGGLQVDELAAFVLHGCGWVVFELWGCFAVCVSAEVV